MRQVVRGHALEHDRRRDPRLDQRGVEGHEVLGGGDHVLGVGPGRARERNVVSRRHVLDALAHGVDLARALQPERTGQVAGVEARALVDVDKVDTGGGELHARLAGARFGDLDVLVAKDLRPAELVYPYGLHLLLPPRWTRPSRPSIPQP